MKKQLLLLPMVMISVLFVGHRYIIGASLEEEDVKESAAIAVINPLSVTRLGLGSTRGIPLDISYTYLLGVFEEYGITTDRWVRSHQEDDPFALEIAKARQKSQLIPAITLDQVAPLVADAHTLIKSFLLQNDADLSLLEDKENYFKKEHGLVRLFGYAKIKQDIQEKDFVHIHLPRKVLVLWNEKTQQYVPRDEATAIIDRIIRAYFQSPNIYKQSAYLCEGSILITEDPLSVNAWSSRDYNFIVFAEVIPNNGRPLSSNAFEELQELCRECPFDVGGPREGNNIFTDANGDAWIIDTEIKADSPESSLKKLERYSHE